MASNLPDHIDTISHHRWKSAMINWIDEFRFTHGVTLVWNRSVGLDRARVDLRNLMHRVDRRLLKSNFNKVPPQHRTLAMFVFEGHRHHHVHVHSLWKAPVGKWFELGKMFPRSRGGVWNTVVESGCHDVTACSWHGSNDEIISYAMKQQHRFSDPQLIVWSHEFHRAR